MSKVTFGIVNCNRLHYLKSCFESIIQTTSEYDNKEFIVVDNASKEPGTLEYLKVLEDRGVKVFRQKERDPSNEFAKGLNIICKESSGDFIIPLQGDMQFVLRGWLTEYVNFYKENLQSIGCITLDAQRRMTHDSHSRSMSQFFGEGKVRFCVDASRPPFAGAGDCMYSREMIESFYPWSEKNKNHEGSLDSETDMLQKVSKIISGPKFLFRQIYCLIPSIPAAVAIYTDARGTNARVRGNKRYGDYWPPKGKNSEYYNFIEIDQAIFSFKKLPVSIEELANPVGWSAPIDAFGNWMKNPIRPETAGENDYTVIEESNA